MRTTLNIDDDVLQAAKDLARHEKTTAGAMISELVRKAWLRLPRVRPRRNQRRSTAFGRFRVAAGS